MFHAWSPQVSNEGQTGSGCVQRTQKLNHMQTTARVLFSPFRLDLDNEQLWKADELVPLRPKPFAVLRYLAEHPGRLVTRKELQNAVWPGTYISEGLLRGYVRQLREVLGDDAAAPPFIETVPRRGYRCLPAVTTPPGGSGQKAESSPPPLPLLPSADRLLPSVLVGRETELTQLDRRL